MRCDGDVMIVLANRSFALPVVPRSTNSTLFTESRDGLVRLLYLPHYDTRAWYFTLVMAVSRVRYTNHLDGLLPVSLRLCDLRS